MKGLPQPPEISGQVGYRELVRPPALSIAPDWGGVVPNPAGPSDWLLWQLADSAFPTGGFAHSGGLESAWQHGEIVNATALESFLKASIAQCGHGALPFVTAALKAPERLFELDELCDAFTTNHVANRASRLPGRALFASARQIFSSPALVAACPDGGSAPCGHWAPVFGVVAAALGLDQETGARLFLFLHLRGLVSAGVRLGIVGPLQAQSIQHRLAPYAESILHRCQELGLEDLAQTAPLMDLWQGTQDRLYSRLFQS
jgi:urease accessory protein